MNLKDSEALIPYLWYFHGALNGILEELREQMEAEARNQVTTTEKSPFRLDGSLFESQRPNTLRIDSLYDQLDRLTLQEKVNICLRQEFGEDFAQRPIAQTIAGLVLHGIGSSQKKLQPSHKISIQSP